MTYFKLEGHIRFENFISKLKKCLGMTSRLVKNQQGFSSHLFGRALVTIVFMLIGWLPSLAHDFEVDGIFYNKTSGKTAAVTYKGDSFYSYSNEYSGDIVIPSSVNYNGINYDVTSIGGAVFHSCSSLTSVVIPNSVTSIGDHAFCQCDRLTSIQIPNSVTSIGRQAFYRCSSLTSIQIPNSVTSIEDEAFIYCSSLTSIEIPNSVTSIGNRAFCACSDLTSVVIGNSVTSIEDEAFKNCSSLTSIVVDTGNTKYDSRNDCNAIIETASNTLIAGCQNTIIPNSVTSIGYNAFYGCSCLTSIEIPNSVTSIGDNAFNRCSSLTSIQIPNSVTSIGDGAFYYCPSLTSIQIPNSVTSIGRQAFYRCSSLTSIQIPNSVTSIEDEAFSDCESLASVEIPNSVTSIGSSAFYYCTSLTSIVIPNSVTSIGSSAFSGCTSLTSIVIPNSVTSIGGTAFFGCAGLTSIVVDAGNSKYDSRNDCNAIIETASNTLIVGCKNTIIPNSVTSIGDSAFQYCSSLTSIEIPDSVTSIGWGVFYGCSSLTSIEIPNSVTSIGDYAFYGCSSLTKITCLATNPPTIKSNTFSNYSATLYVPAGRVLAYQSANYWKKFYNIKEIPTLSTSIALNQTTATLDVTETITLLVTILPENATNKSVEWSSSDETVAIIDENGVVTAVAVGEATITATTVDGSNLSATCKVTVVPTLAETITLDKTEISFEATETATLVATVLPELVTDKSVKWSSSDETVAVVDENGVVTAVAVGEAIITATTADGSNLSATCKVTVIPTLAVSIELDQTEASVEEKSDLQLTAIILPEHATNKEVAWSSSDKWVATVDNTGLVTIHSAGEVIITATTTDGTNLSAICRINVYSGIDGVNGDDVIVATIGDNIVVKNAQLGSNVRVYAADGSIITSEVATDGDVVIEAPVKGIYIVAIDGKSFKVMVK